MTAMRFQTGGETSKIPGSLRGWKVKDEWLTIRIGIKKQTNKQTSSLTVATSVQLRLSDLTEVRKKKKNSPPSPQKKQNKKRVDFFSSHGGRKEIAVLKRTLVEFFVVVANNRKEDER